MSLAAMGDVACIAVAAIAMPDSHARRRIDDEGLDSLARSIEEVGLLQPIVVRPLGNGRYELLAGARVWPDVVIPDGGVRFSSDL